MVLAQQKNSVTNEIYNAVKKQIVTLQLLPGQLLMAQRISEENGVSRTPVREALVRLREENLLEDAGGHKFRVAEITWKLIDDLYKARILIEPFAVAAVAEKLTKSQMNVLRKLVNEMERGWQRQDFAASYEADMAFHNKLLEFYGNQVFLNWMSRIRDQQQRIRFLSAGSEERMKISLDEHKAILSCLEDKDSVGASMAMASHLERSREDLLTLKQQEYAVAGRAIIS